MVGGEAWAGAKETSYAKCLANNMRLVSSAFIVVLFVVITVIVILTARYHKLGRWVWYGPKQAHPQGSLSEPASELFTRMRHTLPCLQ